jgi:hypothetical protein
MSCAGLRRGLCSCRCRVRKLPEHCFHRCARRLILCAQPPASRVPKRAVTEHRPTARSKSSTPQPPKRSPVWEIRVDQYSILIAASAHRDLQLHPVSGHFDSDVWTRGLDGPSFHRVHRLSHHPRRVMALDGRVCFGLPGPLGGARGAAEVRPPHRPSGSEN